MYEYKVIPAPRTAPRHKGARSTAERFAAALQTALNDLGTGGWSFVRAETLPVDERRGLWRKPVEEFHTVLIFRRPQTQHAAPDAATAQPRHKFFAERIHAPASASAPALGSATDPGAAETPALRAEKAPDQPDDDAAGENPAGKSANKSAANAAK